MSATKTGPRNALQRAAATLMMFALNAGGYAGGAILCPALAQAQSGGDSKESGQLQEVTVTATRREESLSRVPVSVQAYTQEALDRQGITDIDDIVKATPGVAFNRSESNGGRTFIGIRGIYSEAAAATTGVYLDETPIQMRSFGTTSTNAYPGTFDVERVEVLRGPQGTLFGAGAEGGVLRFIMPQPSLSKSTMYVRSEMAQTEHGGPSYEAGVAGGTPLVDDRVGFHASVWYRHDGGYVDRVDPLTGTMLDNNSNFQDAAAGRLAVLIKPTDGLSITPSVIYQRTRVNDTSFYWDSLSDPAQEEFRNGRPTRQWSLDQFALPALLVEKEFAGFSLISNTSFFYHKSTGEKDETNDLRFLLLGDPYPSLPGEAGPAKFLNLQNVFTQEVRLQSTGTGRLRWTVGGFYSNSRGFVDELWTYNKLDEALMDATNGAPFCPPGGCNVQDLLGSPLLPGNVIFKGDEHVRDEQLAAFGQVDADLTTKLTATLGLRVAQMKFRHETLTDGPLAGGPQPSSGSQKQTPLTPKVGLSYQYDERNLYYASAAKGFRPGGANVVVQVIPLCDQDLEQIGLKEQPTQYNSDSVWSYEMGAKNRLFDNRLQLAGSVFYIKWSDIIQRVALPHCSGFNANLGSATSKGADLQAELAVTPELTWTVTAGYTQATYDETVGGGASVIVQQGKPIQGVQPWNATTSLEYELRNILGHSGFVRLDYEYLSAKPGQNPAAFGYDPALQRTQATNFFTLRAGLNFGFWRVSAFVDNLTNDHPAISRIDDVVGSPVLASGSYRPRTIGINAIYRVQ